MADAKKDKLQIRNSTVDFLISAFLASAMLVSPQSSSVVCFPHSYRHYTDSCSGEFKNKIKLSC